MSDESSPDEGKNGYQMLRNQKSLEDILNTAVAFERTAHEFYTSLQDRVSKPLRELVAELAAEEKRHWELFQALMQRDDVRKHIQDRVNTPASDHRFTDYVQRSELGAEPDDQAVLQYALGREQAAMEQYTALAEETPPGPAHELFTFLAKEELEHKKELEKRYYDLVYSTNV